MKDGVGGLHLLSRFDGPSFQVGDGGPFADIEGAGVAGEGVGQAGEGLPAAFQVEGQGLEVLGEHLGCFALPAVPPGQLAQLRRLVGHPLPEDAGIVLQVRDHLGVPRQGVEAQTRKLPVRHYNPAPAPAATEASTAAYCLPAESSASPVMSTLLTILFMP